MNFSCHVSILPLLFVLLNSSWAFATESDNQFSIIDARQVFPRADRVGFVSTNVAAYPVYEKNELLGYIALTDQIKAIPGYSGRPISILFGLDLSAHIVGIQIHHHEEPILVAGIKESQLNAFVAQYQGLNAFDRIRVNASTRPGYVAVDGISGATITVMIINQSVMVAASTVAKALDLPLGVKAPVAFETPSALEQKHGTWLRHWDTKLGHVAFTGFMLTVLMAMLFFQDWLVRRARLFRIARIGFLLFTVFYLGFYHLAQLSIVNILSFLNVLMSGFTWQTLLIDPFIFALWGFIAVSIILWGRGVFCGWLCPFGAVQELLFMISERLNLPKFEFSQMVHERLWAIKYFILILLVGSSLESITLAAQLAEVEPFKTVFVLRFQREWFYILFAASLILLSLFNSKFYCKYLCPLGAALSFGSHFKVFDWLRRRRECGRPCNACASSCQIGAIKPTGEIIDTECHYCLECQVLYWDDHRCPPLVEKKNRRKKGKKPPPVIDASGSVVRSAEAYSQETQSEVQVVTVRPSITRRE